MPERLMVPSFAFYRFIDFKSNCVVTQTVRCMSEFGGKRDEWAQNLMTERGDWGAQVKWWANRANQCAHELVSASGTGTHFTLHTHSCLFYSLRTPCGAHDPKFRNLLGSRSQRILSSYRMSVHKARSFHVLSHLILTPDCSLIWHNLTWADKEQPEFNST